MAKTIHKFTARQQMHAKTYEIFHYKDDKLDSVATHHHDFYEIYFFISGNIEYFIEGKKMQLEAGDLLLISPLELHKANIISAEDSYERIVLWIDADFMRALSTDGTDLAFCFDRGRARHTNILHLEISRRTQLRMLFNILMKETASYSFASHTAATAALAQIVIEINRIAIETEAVEPRSADRSEQLIEQVVNYINHYYDKNILLDKLAEDFLVSKYHLSHEFKRIVGTSIYHYIMLRRLLVSKQLLREGVPPTQVYARCGFKDYANFYRAFKNEYHISPKQFLAL